MMEEDLVAILRSDEPKASVSDQFLDFAFHAYITSFHY